MGTPLEPELDRTQQRRQLPLLGWWNSALQRSSDVIQPRQSVLWQWAGPVGLPIATILLVAVFSVLSPVFLTASNFANILRDAALPTIVAVGLTVCLVMNDYDLSIGATSSFATMLVSVLVAQNSMMLAAGLVITMLAGLVVGLVNGAFVAYAGLSALVVTIAVGSILNGLEFVVSGNNQIYGGYPAGFMAFARGNTGPISNLVIVAAAIVVLFWLVLERTALGRNMRAIGGNSEAARFAGVNIRRTRALGFILCALAATFAGMLYAGKQGVAYPLTGLNVLLPSYAAAFIGAAMFKLGEFNVPGTVIGVLITGITANGLLLLSVPAYGAYLLQGAILLVALLFARVVAKRRGT